ncbi:MAG: hypothetical protein QOH97_2612 [Actinoplanes sp.]|nr:hypothetical protein [Actinoplanes sp.]
MIYCSQHRRPPRNGVGSAENWLLAPVRMPAGQSEARVTGLVPRASRHADLLDFAPSHAAAAFAFETAGRPGQDWAASAGARRAGPATAYAMSPPSAINAAVTVATVLTAGCACQVRIRPMAGSG